MAPVNNRLSEPAPIEAAGWRRARAWLTQREAALMAAAAIAAALTAAAIVAMIG